jgi:hypothetical protein
VTEEDGARPPTRGFLPHPDVTSNHSIVVAASPGDVYRAARDLDMSRSVVIRRLFAMRGIPASATTLKGLERIRFKVIEDVPSDGLVIGLIGKFWTPGGDLLDFDPATFAELDHPGFAKAVWGFRVASRPDGTTSLDTETRIECMGEAAKRKLSRTQLKVVTPRLS